VEFSIFILAMAIISAAGFFTVYKIEYLKYKKVDSENIKATVEASTKLECEKEKTKQEVEKTKQLEIKKECLEKYNRYV